MITYKEYETQIYNWLSSKNAQNRDFTFSVRRKSAEGAEGDYFIGTVKSGYFATTFWFLPVNFPGSSGDCIALIFRHSEKGLNYCFEFTQTKTPFNAQNESALNLCKSLEEPLSVQSGLQRASSDDAKMFTFITKPKQRNYQSVEELTQDIDAELNHVIKSVNEKIEEEKLQNPSFIAHRITPSEFENNNAKMHDRIERFENSNILSAEDDIDFKEYVKKFDYKEVAIYFDFLKEMLDTMDVNLGDDRLLFTCRQNRLNFTIGQRYSFYLNKSDKRGKFGILSKDKLNESSTLFAGTSNVPWFSHFETLYLSESERQSIIDGFIEQLNRSKKSSYRQHNNDEFENAIFNHTIGNSFQIKTEITMPNDFPLNQILYGPPGTGKTYNTVLEAAKIVTGNLDINYDDALKTFNSHLGNQIEFITFHQNYSYEDFIQGLRPDIENGSALTFEKKDGVFKRIADRAYLNLKASENNQIAKQSFKEVFNNYIKSFVEGEVDEIEVKMIKTSYFITDISEKNISFRKNSGGTGHTLSLTTLEKMYNEENTGEIQGLSSYYEPLLKLLLERGKANQNSKITKQNFVIIIDEINRANISRVFGELITLIEEDKRSHGKIPMRVTLPSGDSFIVPSNLYIIGTMNTADKSIALLDIALRRRFEFVPKYPDVTKVKAEYQLIFEKMNTIIKEKKNHDFTIGHAYFMDDNLGLEKIINNKVIPLLLEYFMNSEDQVIEILAAAGIKIGDWPLRMKI